MTICKRLRPCLRDPIESLEPTPNLWTDAWLAALAMSLDYEMTTFDRGFKSFRELNLRLLEMPDRCASESIPHASY